MIIIAGAGPAKPVKYLMRKPRHCFHCNNNTQWILQKNTYFITLFFLPVIPYKKEYITYCPICRYTETLSKEDFEHKIRFEADPFND